MKILNQSRLKQVEVVSLEEIASEIFVLSFEKAYDFIPGQVIGLSLEPEDPSARLYSICSSREDKSMSILFNIVPGGKLTNRLARLQPGDLIYCSKPHGSFFGSMDPSCWIATGTGIAPFVSMLRSGTGGENVLIHGGRKLDSFYFQDIFKDKLNERYIRCCSGEKGDGVVYGRLTSYLMQKNDLPSDYRYYLCGSSEMVVETRDLLVRKGIPFENIMSEIYF